MTFIYEWARPVELWTMALWTLSLAAVTACGSNADVSSPEGGGDRGRAAPPRLGQLLVPIDSSSQMEVTVLSSSGGVTTLSVDASAGDTAQAGTGGGYLLELGAV